MQINDYVLQGFGPEWTGREMRRQNSEEHYHYRHRLENLKFQFKNYVGKGLYSM